MTRNDTSWSNGTCEYTDEHPGSWCGVAGRGRAAADAVDEEREVLGRGAAAAADDVHAELGDEALVRVGELPRA